MQGIERAIIESSAIRLSSREAQNRVPVRRHVSGPHREGDPVVSEFNETGELFVIEGSVRTDRTDRRAEASRGTFHVVLQDIVHLEKPLPHLVPRPPDRLVLERIVHDSKPISHNHRTARPRPHTRRTAPQPALRPALAPEERPYGRARPCADVPLRYWLRR